VTHRKVYYSRLSSLMLHLYYFTILQRMFAKLFYLLSDYFLGAMRSWKTPISAIVAIKAQQLSMRKCKQISVTLSWGITNWSVCGYGRVLGPTSLARGQLALFRPIFQWIPRSTATRLVFIATWPRKSQLNQMLQTCPQLPQENEKSHLAHL